MIDEPTEEEIYQVKIVRDARTRVAIIESWSKDGKSHREGGPASVVRDTSTGTVVKEHWIENNTYHRDGGPAVILRKADTGRVYFSEWYRHGEKISPIRPSRPPPTRSNREPTT